MKKKENKLSKLYLICSIMEMVIGILGVTAFIILMVNGEILNSWIMTCILSVIFIFLGIFGIVNYKKLK